MGRKKKRTGTKSMWMLKKEVKSVLRSRWLILGFIISPLFAWLFQGAFLSFIVAQTTEEPETVYITMQDGDEWGQRLYDNIEGNQSELLIKELINVTPSEGQNLVENRSVSVWVVIPENFTENLEQQNRSTLSIWVNTANYRATAAAARIQNFASNVIDKINVIRRVEFDYYNVAPEATYGHQLAIFLVMITSVLAPSPYVGKSFAGEKERNTLEALLVVPLSRIKILAAKLFAGLLLTMIYSAFTIIGILVYNLSIILRAAALPPQPAQYYTNLYTVNVATLPLIFFCQFLVLLCAIGIGVVISCLSKDQATAESINNLVLLVPTMVIGILGFTGSVNQYGGLFGLFVLAIPFSHAIMFLNGVLSGAATPLSLLGNVAYLLTFTIVFLVLGAKLFEREAIIS
ncbi:MAG: ABC transporter permease subunit [Candidatus Lokiarchaeota archaeon]|nr:ABC transporter permease subunit [Candidatus Lokiarchaeota archaeon]